MPSTLTYPTSFSSGVLWPSTITKVQREPVDALVSQLGQKTQLQNGYLVIFNEPLVEAIAARGNDAVPALKAFFNAKQEPLALVEGIYTAQKLAERKTPGVETLYAPLSQYNTSHDPLVQTYLAGFYRSIPEPASFGPMLATLMHQAMYRYPQQGMPANNVTEELGGSLLQQIAERSAEETVKRLLPYLQPPASAVSGQRLSESA